MNKKSVVGIDIDGVITNYYDYVIAKGMVYFDKFPVYLDKYSISEIFDVSKEKEIEFWKLDNGNYEKTVPIRQGFNDFIFTLEVLEIPYVLITNRCGTSRDEALSVETRKKNTEEFVSKLFSSINTEHFLGIEYTSGSKLAACRKHKVTYMIEDSVDIIKELSSSGIYVYKMNTSYNDSLYGKNIHKVSSFYNIKRDILLKHIYPNFPE